MSIRNFSLYTASTNLSTDSRVSFPSGIPVFESISFKQAKFYILFRFVFISVNMFRPMLWKQHAR